MTREVAHKCVTEGEILSNSVADTTTFAQQTIHFILLRLRLEYKCRD